MIKCCNCKTLKDDSEFSFRNKSKNTRCSSCKKCHGTYVKEHYKKNKKSYIARSDKNTKKKLDIARKNICDFLITKSCVDCGETDIRVLDFDHNDPSQKEDSVYTMVSRGFPWQKIELEIEKCTVRCANCHRKRTNKQFGFYRNSYLTNI